jgi:hypothetical protein
MTATQKQIETLNSLVNEINDIVNKAKNSANYGEFSDLIERALSGVMISHDGGGTMVDTARKSNDKTLYSTTISLLIRTKQRVQNIVDYYRN